jgi:hypothetical protein
MCQSCGRTAMACNQRSGSLFCLPIINPRAPRKASTTSTCDLGCEIRWYRTVVLTARPNWPKDEFGKRDIAVQSSEQGANRLPVRAGLSSLLAARESWGEESPILPPSESCDRFLPDFPESPNPVASSAPDVTEPGRSPLAIDVRRKADESISTSRLW